MLNDQYKNVSNQLITKKTHFFRRIIYCYSIDGKNISLEFSTSGVCMVVEFCAKYAACTLQQQIVFILYCCLYGTQLHLNCAFFQHLRIANEQVMINIIQCFVMILLKFLLLLSTKNFHVNFYKRQLAKGGIERLRHTVQAFKVLINKITIKQCQILRVQYQY